MSPSPEFDPKQEFAARLARIEAGGINTNRTLFVGMEDMLHLPPGTFVRKRKRRGRALPLFLTLVVGSAGAIVAGLSQTQFY
jgi:hypothetical protein